MKRERVVARLGLSTAIPALVNGEIGFDLDTKTFRVGDDTNAPPKVITDKSRGVFDYVNVESVKFRKVDIYPGGTVAGLPLGQIAAKAGFVVYDKKLNKFIPTTLEHDEYIQIKNPDGVDGAPKIGVSQALLDGIGRLANLGGFSYGPYPPNRPDPTTPGVLPPTVNPGHMWWSTTDQLLYILVADNPDTSWWVDVGGTAGGGAGMQTHVGPEFPINANIGDFYLDSGDAFRCYWRTRDDNSIFWREILI